MTPSHPRDASGQLLMLACSQRKHAGDAALPAIEMYRGVMYQTLRTHADPRATPQLVILSAEHGFLRPEDCIRAYDRRMDARRADALLANLQALLAPLAGLADIEAVQLCGGAAYRRVMLAAVDAMKARGQIRAAAPVTHSAGQLGEQRAQLGSYLRRLAIDAARSFARPEPTCQLQLTSKADLTHPHCLPAGATA